MIKCCDPADDELTEVSGFQLERILFNVCFAVAVNSVLRSGYL